MRQLQQQESVDTILPGQQQEVSPYLVKQKQADSQQAEPVRSLEREWVRKRPMQALALQITGTECQSLEDIQLLLDALCNLSWRGRKERDLAALLLGQVALTESQRQTCLATLLPFVERRMKSFSPNNLRTLGRWFCRSLPFSLLLLIWFLIWSLTDSDFGIKGGSLFSLVVGLLILLAVFSGLTIPFTLPLSLHLDNRKMARLCPAVIALGHLRAPESIVTLAGAVTYKPLRTAATPALEQALAALTPDHFGALHSQTVPNLRAALDIADERLQATILEGLRHIGDGRAIRAVQRLADMGSIFAREILPILKARQEQENQSTMLLRAASAGTSASGHLLRPAGAASATDPQELLRAAAPEEDAGD